MSDQPSSLRSAAGRRLLHALDEEGLGVRACYWRRLRPTRNQWALVICLAERASNLPQGLNRLLELCADRAEDLQGLDPLDLWVLEPHEPEPARYARAVAEVRSPWPRAFPGDRTLPPALLYRLPAP